MIYFLTLVIFVTLAFVFKIKFFKEPFTKLGNSGSINELAKRLLIVVVVFFLIYFIIWSFLNYWFYINLYILYCKLNYSFFESITIASNLTNELSSGLYYLQLCLQHILGHNMYNTIISDLQPQIQSIINSYGEISDINSQYTAFLEFVKIFLL